MRARIPLPVPLLLAFAVPAGAGESDQQSDLEINPIRPAAARLLKEPEACLGYAEEVARVLVGRARETEHGLSFSRRPTPDVYSGDAGVALFFFALHRSTGKKEWLATGRRTLDQALATGMSSGPGLYTGVSGIGQVCLDAWEASKDGSYLKKARACAAQVGDYTATDLISGAAGTGVFLLNLHAATKEKRYLEAARRAGDYLARTAIREAGGARWAVAPGRNPRVYLGLSHGAAGIGRLLLHLHRATGEQSYRTLAEEAARFLLAHAMKEGEDGTNWERTVPPTANDTIRVQWCHGAPGIGLFLADMHRHLGGDEYREALLRCVATTRRLGRTARRSGSQCHGIAGNAELFLEADGVLGDPAQAATAREFASALLIPDGDGFRVRVGGYGPSYMTGLAGIGHFFLRLADPEKTALPLTVAR